jgi:hypothetical protein
MSRRSLLGSLLCAGLFAAGCVGPSREPAGTLADRGCEPDARSRVTSLPAETRQRILALDPEHVTEAQVRDVLSNLPAPQIISIHGGLLPIKAGMNSFAEFLIGMGYPEASIRDPATGSLTYGPYEPSDYLAGRIAWYYERDGLRPMLVGHSLGGFHAIRVLYKLAGDYSNEILVYNPETQRQESRTVITDPLTGTNRPVVGVQVCYATVAVAGGVGRFVPLGWDLNNKLREIPDSVEEFTGFQKGLDLLGGDYFGYGAANDYKASGQARVRNVRLPATSAHLSIPDAKGLLEDQTIKEWIASYEVPSPDGAKPDPGSKSARALWAAEVWYGIRKHWVLELQRLIRASAWRVSSVSQGSK